MQAASDASKSRRCTAAISSHESRRGGESRERYLVSNSTLSARSKREQFQTRDPEFVRTSCRRARPWFRSPLLHRKGPGATCGVIRTFELGGAGNEHRIPTPDDAWPVRWSEESFAIIVCTPRRAPINL